VRSTRTVPVTRTEVRIPTTLWERLQDLAAAEYRSANAQLVKILEQALDDEAAESLAVAASAS
jgi:hypothetical protein